MRRSSPICRRVFVICESSLLLFIFNCSLLCAQSESSLSSLSQEIASVYSELLRDSIPSCFLRDKAIDLVKLPAHNGQALTDSNYVDAALFRDFLRTMSLAIVKNPAPLLNAESVYTSITEGENVKLTSALFNYCYIIDTALSDGLITYNQATGKLYDKYVNNVWQNPYSTAYAFLFTSGRQAHTGLGVCYDLSNLISYNNCSVDGLYVDFANGEGYIPAGNLTTKTVVYDNYGMKELKMKVVLEDNTVLESHSYINVEQNVMPYAIPPATSDVPEYADTVSFDGISATYSIKYALGHTTLRKPLIYVEGFDHPILAEFTNLHWSSFNRIINDECIGNYDYYYIYSKIKNYISDYDFIYVDWNNPEADIKQNAHLLESVIQEVNNRKPADGSGQKTVLIAHSMGGLISRWALRQMESKGTTHQVGWFVSQDVPYLGAVVPIGAQHTLRDIYRFLFGPNGNDGVSNNCKLKIFFDKIVGVLDCTSAQQMMYNYIKADGSLDTGPNTPHNLWLRDLNGVGFPQGDRGCPIENLAIVSGNYWDSSELAQSILSATVSLTTIPTIKNLLTMSNMTVSLVIDRDRSSGSMVSRTTVSYFHHPFSLWHYSFPFAFLNKTHSSSVDTGQYDVVPGSSLGMNSMPAFLSSIIGNGKIVFIPVGSALASGNYNRDYYNNPPTPGFGCQFDSYCFEEDAMRHDTDLAAYINWILSHVQLTMSGPDAVVRNGEQYYIDWERHEYGNRTWTAVSDSTASINDYGLVTVFKHEPVTLSYSSNCISTIGYNENTEYHNQKRFHIKSKTVFAGFPEVNLHHSHLINDTYSITASFTSNNTYVQPFADTLAARGKLKYIWGYKNSDNSYSWIDTTSTRSFICTAAPGVDTHVIMKMHCNSLRESIISEVQIDRRTIHPFLFNPIETAVSEDFYISNYSVITSGIVLVHQFLAIWHNSDYQGTPIAPDSIQIGSQTFSLSNSYSTTIDGESKTIYCFSFINSTGIQNAISQIQNNFSANYGLTSLVPIQIKNGSTVLQTIQYPLIPSELPPLDPVPLP